jgi:3-oxoacyl-[acyl-carrier protein] reductase
MTDKHRLDGQTAIVTGAAQGIGRGIALVLANAGARVVVGDIQEADHVVREILSEGGDAVSMQIDTSVPEDARRLVDMAMDQYGALDILVNNAAIDAPSGNAWDLTDDEWERTIAVNLSGVFYCSRAALVPMLDARRGVIVNISSQSARQGAIGLSPAYNASKAGVLGLTASLAEQVSARGVRVNAVLPALVESRDFGWTAEQRKERAKAYPLGLGTPEDIGEAVLYLVSPAAKWVSGTSLHVTGGAQRGSSVL